MLVHIEILHFWMTQSTEMMALTLGGAFALFALFLCWLTFASPLAPMMASWKGVAPPFVGVPATLFGLLMTFLSQDVWDANRRAYREIAMEREQLATLSALGENHGGDASDLPRAVRGYVEAVVGLEWKAMENGEESPEAEAALNTLTRAASSARIEPAFQRALIDTVMKLRSAREQRLAIAGAYPDDRKWAAIILIAFITQASLAAVHLDRARPQLLAQALFAAAAVVAIALVAAVEEPYSPPKAVSSEPLEQLLEKLPGR
ncbi:bestrophin-like domain [Methylocystis sp. S23]